MSVRFYSVRITAVRQTTYPDLMEQWENPLDTPCEVRLGQVFVSHDGKRPEGLCAGAWLSLAPFVQALARGEGDFYDGWMKDPHTALVSCNDGFRPVSFFLERISECVS